MASNAIAPSAPSQEALDDAVRPITATEAAFFIQNGWVILRGLVRPEACRAMLNIGKARLAGLLGEGEAPPPPGGEKVSLANDDGSIVSRSQWVEWRGAVRTSHDPVFESVALCRTMGRNVRLLLERDRSMRVYHDIFMCKQPDNTSTPTDFHQDASNFALDRNVLTAWIALDEITPDQGPVQFYSGSHRSGLLGRIPPDREKDIVDEYPELKRFPLSPAHHLQPGDCTVHHGLVVHGANANATPRPRWSYIASYFPADTRYTGAPNHDTDGYGLKKGYPLDHPSFRRVID